MEETITKEIWHTAYIALGSNLGDKKKNLESAIEFMNQDAKTKVLKHSAFIETEPMGEVVQDDFLNGAAKIQTLRSPEELLELVAEIESKLKRVRMVHWGPRTIDLDIIFYDDLILTTDNLTIPHIGMAERDFVLDPMCEIAPDKIHPKLLKTVQQLREALQSKTN